MIFPKDFPILNAKLGLQIQVCVTPNEILFLECLIASPTPYYLLHFLGGQWRKICSNKENFVGRFYRSCFHKDCWDLNKQKRGRRRNWAKKRTTGEQYQEARGYSSLLWIARLGKKYRGGVHKLSSFWRTVKINLKGIGLRTKWSQKFSGKGEKWLQSFHKMNKTPVWWFIGCERRNLWST